MGKPPLPDLRLYITDTVGNPRRISQKDSGLTVLNI
jgi:hypothetical protein